MFDTTKEDLKDILRKADEGKLQLPDFQRDYVWTDEGVRGLIASIAKGFPVGALLTLESGSEVRFKPRLLEGVPEKQVEPHELLLDGQQRITSMYQAAYSQQPVKTRLRQGREVERHYYLDIKRCVRQEADLIEAIIGVPSDRVVRSNFGKDIELDLSTREREFEHDMFPLSLTFDSKNWFYGWRDYWKPQGRDISELEREFDLNVLEHIERYKMPIIRLDRKNSREAICLVFEKVNVGGKKLDAFELLTAIYAADDFDLREEWRGTGKRVGGLKKRLIGGDFPRNVLKKIDVTGYLQVCTLLHTRDIRLKRAESGARAQGLPQISCNRQSLLGLPLSAYRNYTKTVEQGFIDAASFLNELKIISHRDVPYPSQVVALASIFAILNHDAHNAQAKQKLMRWFWCGSLGQLYGSGSDSRIARDVPAIVDWIRNEGPPPPSVEEAVFRENRLRNLRSRKSAAYKAVHALLMAHGCRDFVSGDPVELMTFHERRIDIHHIFPEKWCKQRKIEPRVYNSIVNKTPLSKRSNIRVSGDAPSVYLDRIQKKDCISAPLLDDILQSHLINPALLRSDSFEEFYNARIRALSNLIAEAMGKPVVVAHEEQLDDLEEIDDDETDVASEGIED